MTKTLLVVDDSANIRKVFKMTFEGKYQVMATEKGETGWEVVRSIVPDLIFIDANMPGMSGYELSRLIKNDEVLQCIPVILMVGTFDTYDEALGQKAKFDKMITKPFETEFILHLVAEELANAEKKITQTLQDAQEVKPVADASPREPVPKPQQDEQKTKKIHLPENIDRDEAAEVHDEATLISAEEGEKFVESKTNPVKEDASLDPPWEEADQVEADHVVKSGTTVSDKRNVQNKPTSLSSGHVTVDDSLAVQDDFVESDSFSPAPAADFLDDQAFRKDQSGTHQKTETGAEDALPMDMLETTAEDDSDLQLLRADSAFAESEPDKSVGVYDSVYAEDADLLVKADDPYDNSLVVMMNTSDHQKDDSLFYEAVDDAAILSSEDSAVDDKTADWDESTTDYQSAGPDSIADEFDSLEKDFFEAAPSAPSALSDDENGSVGEIEEDIVTSEADGSLMDTMTMHPRRESVDNGDGDNEGGFYRPKSPDVQDPQAMAESPVEGISLDVLDSLIEQAVARFWTQRGHELADLVADRVYAKIVKRLMGRIAEILKEQDHLHS